MNKHPINGKSLFRQEAIEYQTEEKLGQPLDLKITTLSVFAFALLITFLAGVISLFTREFSNKIEAIGWIAIPNQIINVTPSERRGIVESILVKEGQNIKRGEPLFSVRRSLESESSIEQKALMLRLLSEQKQSLESKAKQLRKQYEDDQNYTLNQIDHIEQQLKISLDKYALLHTQITETKEQLTREKTLQDAGLSYLANVSSIEQKITSIQIKMMETTHHQVVLYQQLDTYKNKIKTLDNQLENQLRKVEDSQRNNRIDHDRLALEHHYTINAPFSGYISDIHIQRGSDLSNFQTIAKIISNHHKAEAQIVVPSNAIGLIQKEQAISIRLDSFPHEKFGKLTGKLTDVSETISMPIDLVNTPIPVDKPVFQAKASLETYEMNIKGKKVALKHGMTFRARISLDKQSIIQWFLAPIYRMRGAL